MEVEIATDAPAPRTEALNMSACSPHPHIPGPEHCSGPASLPPTLQPHFPAFLGLLSPLCPLLPEAQPHLRVLICFWPNPWPCLLYWAQYRRRVCRPPSPLGSWGAADEGKARPATGLGRQPWPHPCTWHGAAALILVTVLRRPEPGPRATLGPQGHPSEAGKRQEPSPWPLTEAHLDP